MGFDLVIAGGPENRLFPEELMACLVEVRVEQTLDEPTRFAIRFQDDIVDGALRKASVPELQVGREVAVAVRAGDALQVLVRGPILGTQSQMTRGGPGSAYTVEGLDGRDALAREYREGSWTGRASDVVRLILSQRYPDSDVAATEEVHEERGNPLRQRGTDLDFVTTQARQNSYRFWIDYEASAIATGGQVLRVTERARWKPSPELQDSAPLPVPPLPLGEDAVVLRYNTTPAQCPNVTRWEVRRDGTRPNRVNAATQSLDDGETDAVTGEDQASPMGGASQRAADAAGVRFIVPTPQGGASETRRVNMAALREAGFFVKAEISTTAHLLRAVLLPHQVVAVEGVGGRNGTTPFLVAEVTHVINGVGHFMDAKLETNAEVAV
jgi:hypothetical protein